MLAWELPARAAEGPVPLGWAIAANAIAVIISVELGAMAYLLLVAVSR